MKGTAGVGMLLGAMLALCPASSGAVVFTVDSTVDAVDATPGDGLCASAADGCTLRAAVMEANALAGEDAVGVPPGHYLLTVMGSRENLGATGDLDVTDGLLIFGAGADQTSIEAGVDWDDPLLAALEGRLQVHDLRLTNEDGVALLTGSRAALEVVRTTITENRGGFPGGILSIESEVRILESTISRNDGFGLGIFGGSAVLVDSTVSGHELLFLGKDRCVGGMPILDDGELSIVNSTVAGNRIDTGCGYIINGSGALSLARTIIANDGSNCDALSVSSYGHNVVHDDTCGLTDPTDLPNTDPMLGPLQSNGGPTATHALLPGSPAIDAIPVADCTFDDDGDPGTPEVSLRTDQRGARRPQGAGCDVGAFEVTACSNSLDDDGDGRVDTADPGCSTAISMRESPQCQDGLNNDNAPGIDFDGGASLDLDGDGLIDAQFNPATPAVGSADPQCVGKPWSNKERSGCGLGFEVVFLAPLLARLARKRRAQPSPRVQGARVVQRPTDVWSLGGCTAMKGTAGGMLLGAMLALCPASSGAVVFTVDSTVDAVDANPGDGVCADAAGACTLRAAVMEANVLPGEDLVEVPAATYPLSSGIDIASWTDGLTLSGAGARVTVIDAAGVPPGPNWPSSQYALWVGGPGAPVVLEGLTITGSGGPAVVALASNLRLSRVAVTGNFLGVHQSDAGLLRVEQSLIAENDFVDLLSVGVSLCKLTCRCDQMGRLSLENTTVQRLDIGDGGFFDDPCGNVTDIVHSTLTAGLSAGAPTTFERSIILGSCGPYWNLTSGGHNIADNATCSRNLTDPTDLPNTNPLLGPLRDNGGPTETHALLPGSPAIDAIPLADCTFDDDGDPATPEVPLRRDQRGAARPQGAGCDIGAVELTACSDGLDNDGDGRVDYPSDPGCFTALSVRESPQCQDGLNNDNATGIDFDGGASLDLDHDGFIDTQFNPATPAVGSADPQCAGKPWANKERSGCGLGFEIVLLAPLLARLARKRRAQPSPRVQGARVVQHPTEASSLGGCTAMKSRLPVSLIAAVFALGSALLRPQAAAGGQACLPTYDPAITSPAVAIPGWPARVATADEIDAYVTGIALETDRVVTGQFGTSWSGRPLYYALVGDAATVADAEAVAAAQRALRDPRTTSPEAAAAIAAGSPAIVWYVGALHGNEPSGGDAALQLLYELAARTDCVGEALRASLLVGVIACQNPDGRVAGRHTNEYGFDLGRDGIARTQPENDARLALLQQYPPALVADAHQMTGGSFFFPPAADPVHHEISAESLSWQNDLYGPALAQAFDERQPGEPGEWTYFNYGPFDLFVPEYTDTVTTLAFGAAGMTFEKGALDPAEQRFEEHFVAGWTALLTAAEHKEQILGELYQSYVRALADGALGALEPNEVQEPGNEVVQRVPDEPVRHYFLGTGRARADADRLVARLRALGVEVYRLTKPLRVPRLRAYGERPKTRKLPEGTYWIPLDQPQKRWIQAALGEDGYASVPYFYDVAAWSEPLAGSLDAWLTGAELQPTAELVGDAPRPTLAPTAFYWIAGDTARSVGAALALAGEGMEVRRLRKARGEGKGKLPPGAFVVSGDPDAIEEAAARFGVPVQGSDKAFPPGLAVHVPRIAVYDPGLPAESFDQLRFLLDQVLDVPWTTLDGPAVAAGGLSDFDVFVVAGVFTFPLDAARDALESWIAAGGTYVGTTRPGGAGGTPFAIASGWTSATAASPAELDVPGSFFRVELDSRSPVTLGAGKTAYWMQLGEQVLSPTTTGVNAGRFPAKLKKLWLSGYAQGEETLLGSAALLEEVLGQGHLVLFSGEPNFRAWTPGTQLLLANALVYPKDETLPLAATDVRAPEAAPAVARARASAGPSIGPGRPIRIRVPAARGDDALAVAHRFTPDVRALPSGATSVLEIPNPEGLAPDEHPFSRALLQALRAAGIEVLYAAL